MNIIYSENLITYMKKKNYPYIIIASISPKGCCADTTELLTGFASEKAGRSHKHKGCKVLKAPYGEILVLTPGLEYEEEILLGLRSFFGLKDITVKGIAPWKL